MVDEVENLLVFGYSAKIFKDDKTARYIHEGKNLIPWIGDTNILIDRYDCRGFLNDLPTSSHITNDLDLNIERLCEQERYVALYKDLTNPDPYEDELKKLQQEILSVSQENIYSNVGYNYETNDNSADIEEIFAPLPDLEVPPTMEIPPNVKQNSIIEMTANFVSKQGLQMEIVMKAKQARNPLFGFMNFDHSLHSYYKHVLHMIKEGKYRPQYVPKKNMDEDESSDDDGDSYLHPSLFKSTSNQEPTAIQHVDQTSKISADIGNKILSSSSNHPYSVLVSKISHQNRLLKLKEGNSSNSDSNNDDFVLDPSEILKETANQSKAIKKPREPTENQTKTKRLDFYQAYDGYLVEKPLSITPEFQTTVTKLVEYVLRNGVIFEAEITLKKQDPRFPFLADPTHSLYPYYIYQMKRFFEAIKQAYVEHLKIQQRELVNKYKKQFMQSNLSASDIELKQPGVVDSPPIAFDENDLSNEKPLEPSVNPDSKSTQVNENSNSEGMSEEFVSKVPDIICDIESKLYHLPTADTQINDLNVEISDTPSNGISHGVYQVPLSNLKLIGWTDRCKSNVELPFMFGIKLEERDVRAKERLCWRIHFRPVLVLAVKRKAEEERMRKRMEYLSQVPNSTHLMKVKDLKGIHDPICFSIRSKDDQSGLPFKQLTMLMYESPSNSDLENEGENVNDALEVGDENESETKENGTINMTRKFSRTNSTKITISREMENEREPIDIELIIENDPDTILSSLFGSCGGKGRLSNSDEQTHFKAPLAKPHIYKGKEGSDVSTTVKAERKKKAALFVKMLKNKDITGSRKNSEQTLEEITSQKINVNGHELDMTNKSNKMDMEQDEAIKRKGEHLAFEQDMNSIFPDVQLEELEKTTNSPQELSDIKKELLQQGSPVNNKSDTKRKSTKNIENIVNAKKKCIDKAKKSLKKSSRVSTDIKNSSRKGDRSTDR